MSHLACADTPEHPLNDKQIRLFRDIRVQLSRLASSLANSSGIFLGSTVHCDLVRPGIALYGVNPTPGRNNPDAAGRRTEGPHHPGAHGRARRHRRLWRDLDRRAAEPHRDGRRRLCRRLFARGERLERQSPAAKAIVAGKLCPIVGRVSMDLIAVDVTELPEGTARRGDFATLIGDGIDVDDLGAAMGTIGYEVLTNLGRRYHRIYKDA